MIRRVLFLSGVVLLCAVLAGFGGAVHPALDSLSVLRPHLTLIAAALFLLAVLLRAGSARLGLALPMVVGLLGMAPVALFTQSAVPPDERVTAHTSLHLISYNVLYSNRQHGPIGDWLLEELPDVLALQEVGRHQSALLKRLTKSYPHRIACSRRSGLQTLVLSRLPVTGRSGCIGAPTDRIAWMEVLWNDKPLSVLAVHLQWPWPKFQANQVDRLAQEFAELPQPIVVAGDFNAMPWSHTVSRMEEMTGTRLVSGLLPTYVGGEFILPLPIDHVLAPEHMAAVTTFMGPALGSDHRPVVIHLE